MIGIVIVAHEGLAAEYRKTIEHVMGGPQPGIVSISVGASCDRAGKMREICEAADAVDTGQGVVVVADVYGSSPSNLALPACAPGDRLFFYGANVPALLKLAQVRRRPVAEAVALAKRAGLRYMDVADGPRV